MSVPDGMQLDDVTLDAALALLALPREVGVHPVSGERILAGIGRYGPWLRHGHIYAAIPEDDDVLTVPPRTEISARTCRGVSRERRPLASAENSHRPCRTVCAMLARADRECCVPRCVPVMVALAGPHPLQMAVARASLPGRNRKRCVSPETPRTTVNWRM